MMASQEKEEYIVFADPVVEQICATNWGDGIGITPSQAARVTDNQFGAKFQGNTQITSFNELQYFTGLTTIPNNAFEGCTALESVTIAAPAIGANSFKNCTNLNCVSFTTQCSVNRYSFNGVSSITRYDIPSIDWFALTEAGTHLPRNTGYRLYINGAEITEVVASGTPYLRYAIGITKVTINEGVAASSGAYYLADMSEDVIFDFPSTLASIDNATINNSKAVCVLRATQAPTTLGRYNTGWKKAYVPYSSDHSILDAYKATAGWSDKPSQIFELNPDGTIPS